MKKKKKEVIDSDTDDNSTICYDDIPEDIRAFLDNYSKQRWQHSYREPAKKSVIDSAYCAHQL